MGISNDSTEKVIALYSACIKELKNRGVLRTKNVVGELGEYYVFQYYLSNDSFPTLKSVPLGTKNYNAINDLNERYSIKTTSGTVTGAFWGLQPPDSTIPDEQLFDYLVICKLDDYYMVEGIYQLTWESFLKYKKWHTRIRAWNITLTNEVKKSARIIYERNQSSPLQKQAKKVVIVKKENTQVFEKPIISWNKTQPVDHPAVKASVAKMIEQIEGIRLIKESASRFSSDDKEVALFAASATYSQRNQEYWYSIDKDNIPWLEPFPICKVAFALGSDKEVLVFDFQTVKSMLKGCLQTKEDPQKNKRPHYHISFSVENNGKVYFKKKVPEREFIDVTRFLIRTDEVK